MRDVGMAKQVQVMPPAVLPPLQPGDERPTPDELGVISVFASMKKSPNFEKFPGTFALRRCVPGRVICTQGEEGGTAFLILRTEDVLRLREKQLASIEAVLAARAEGRNDADPHKHFSPLDERALKVREPEIRQEIETLRARAEELSSADDLSPQRRVASANLLTSLDANRLRRGFWDRFMRPFGAASGEDPARRTGSIPIDGPTDIDAGTLRAPLHEGELFGEMSCMNRAARSATVVVERHCYMLEVLRNVLDMLNNDPHYKARMDDAYRRRVLESQVRRLSIFSGLSDDEFRQLQQSIELVEHPAGEIIFEEHEPSDSFYVIRSGLVKVVQNAWSLVRREEFNDDADATALCSEISALREIEVGRIVWQSLGGDVQSEITRAAESDSLDETGRQAILDALNQFIRLPAVPKEFGKGTDELLQKVDNKQIAVAVSGFPQVVAKWSDIERRTFLRLLLEHLCPSLPRRAANSGPRRTLAYLGRGEYFGEMGVMAHLPRNATVYAYDHPDGSPQQRIPDSRTGAVPSRVELVKIGIEAFERLIESSTTLQKAVKEEVLRRQAKLAAMRETPAGSDDGLPGSAEFEELGLVQGQQLMLIDLDRCTRCGACVDACVKAHDDGHTRLYLDGPRFGNYLVPLTCRKCLDPVCMIGCPVGAINRGSNGEIRIENWCIGCRMCAEQCPYGSIQMTELAGVRLNPAQAQLLSLNEEIRSVDERAVVCDLCSRLPSQDPSCVYACPHDAALRVNARDFFLKSLKRGRSSFLA